MTTSRTPAEWKAARPDLAAIIDRLMDASVPRIDMIPMIAAAVPTARPAAVPPLPKTATATAVPAMATRTAPAAARKPDWDRAVRQAIGPNNSGPFRMAG